MWTSFKPRAPLVAQILTRKCCTEAFCFLPSMSLPYLGMISACFRCIPGQGEGTFIDLFPSFLTIVSFHLPPQVMAVLIPSQTINSGVLWDPSLALHQVVILPLAPTSSPTWLMWLLFEFQTMTAPTPSRPTRWPGCTATWTWSTRAGSPPRNLLPWPLPPRSWLAPPPLSPWSGSHPSMATSLKGDHALLCTLLLEKWEGEHSLVMCCAQPGLRLFPKLVCAEEVIDLLSALPFSACSTQLKAIDLPCKGQIFLHMLWEEFSIKDSCPVIPAVVAAHEYLWALAVPARSPLLPLYIPFARTKWILFLQHRAHGRGGGWVRHRDKWSLLPWAVDVRWKLSKAKSQTPGYDVNVVL